MHSQTHALPHQSSGAVQSLLDHPGALHPTAPPVSLKLQIERLDATVSDVVDRTRLHVIRADELVTRTMDRVEETTDLVHHSVVSPVRQIAGLVQGLTAGLGALLGQRRSRRHADQPQDEMFI